MTREELTAKLRKLTGKTATDIEALDERVDALEASAGGGGGVELSTLDVTVTFTGANHMFTGVITSEIPENTVITNIIKIENVLVSQYGDDEITSIQPLPLLKGTVDSNNNVTFIGLEVWGTIDPAPAGMNVPLGVMITKIDTRSDLTTLTETFKITYV